MNINRRKKAVYSAWIRIVLYVIMLLMVGASMRLIISEETREFIKTLLSSGNGAVPIQSQKMNWCPTSVTKIIVIATKKEITSAVDLFKLCETESEPYESKDLASITFQPFLTAISNEDEKLSLEIGSVSGFFRIGDLPFRSSHLEKELSKYR